MSKIYCHCTVGDDREKFLFYYTPRVLTVILKDVLYIWHLHNYITTFRSDICQLKMYFKGPFNKSGLFLIETFYYLGKTCLNKGAHNNSA